MNEFQDVMSKMSRNLAEANERNERMETMLALLTTGARTIETPRHLTSSSSSASSSSSELPPSSQGAITPSSVATDAQVPSSTSPYIALAGRDKSSNYVLDIADTAIEKWIEDYYCCGLKTNGFVVANCKAGTDLYRKRRQKALAIITIVEIVSKNNELCVDDGTSCESILSMPVPAVDNANWSIWKDNMKKACLLLAKKIDDYVVEVNPTIKGGRLRSKTISALGAAYLSRRIKPASKGTSVSMGFGQQQQI
jgi:hypothetical protein